MLFDLAAKLIWKGGEHVYNAEKRDIAKLYEYWLFFQLYDLFIGKFEFTEILYDNSPIEHIIDNEHITGTKDGLGLKLKSGIETSLTGTTKGQTRELSVRFSYNRTYSGNTKYFKSGSFYDAKDGSWTKPLRPDYTLSLWPSKMDEDDAEAEDMIVHIHFDAKYKVKWQELLSQKTAEDENKQEGNASNETKPEADEYSDNPDQLEKEKREERKGIYKNADLIKMHAYKDAIRRTGGAYVLYPGEGLPKETNPSFLGFHEIIPGLGAFAIRPSASQNRENTGISELSDFVDKVINNFQDRASQRERVAAKSHSVHKSRKKTYKEDNKTLNITSEPLPEYFDVEKKEKLVPDDTSIIVGYFKSPEHLDWITSNQLYNGRTGTAKGAMNLTPEIIGAKYLLLHKEKEDRSGRLYKIKQSEDQKPKILSVKENIFNEYPEPNHDFYLVFYLEKAEDVFLVREWAFKDLPNYSEDKDAFPFTCTLTELMATEYKQT